MLRATPEALKRSLARLELAFVLGRDGTVIFTACLCNAI